MAAKHVAYEVDGWGVGELWVEDERVVWHELPHPKLPRPKLSSEAPSRQALSRERLALGGEAGAGEISGPSLAPTHPRGTGNVSGPSARARDDFGSKVVRAIERYFAGDPRAIAAVPVDLEYDSEFHARCAEALRAVPPGQVVTYGEVAALAGAPGAARAAGSFCARNRLGLFVPCHRVVGAAGLGSYGSFGLAYKRRLLALEGYEDAV